jgi:hypothetical protein
MYFRHCRSNLLRSKLMSMSGCAVGICGVRVDRAGGLDMRPDARMTVTGLLNWWGVIVCVWMGAMVMVVLSSEYGVGCRLCQVS